MTLHLARLSHLLPLATLAALFAVPLARAETPVGQSTAEAVGAAAWASDITVTIDGQMVRLQSDGLPNHDLADAYLIPLGQQQPFTEFEIKQTDGFVVESPFDVTLPLVPVWSDAVTDTSLGMIGVMISGSPLFNDYENPERSIVAMDDQNVQDGVAFLDTCNGHPLQTGATYHYHASPPCVTETVDGAGSHSQMIGLLLDGFPIYGPQGDGGVIVTNADLDQCSGHTGPTPEFAGGIYHYHLTTMEAPYSVDCYHGVVDPALITTIGRPGGMPPDFAAIAAKLGVTEHDLKDALTAKRPPDLEAAAAILGIPVEDLRAALPPPP